MPQHPTYTLSTDPWWCWDPGDPISRPSYAMGQRTGSIGCRAIVALSVPSFPSHDAAIRATLNGAFPPMPDLTAHRPLRPAEVLDLRVAAKAPTYDPGAVPLAVQYNATTNAYELRMPNGPALTAHADIAVIGALLRAERFEPGFIRRVLDPAYLPGEAALDADAREQARRERDATDASTRARVREDQERARAALHASLGTRTAPPDLTLDDLIRDL